jgi:hypothetical protein
MDEHIKSIQLKQKERIQKNFEKHNMKVCFFGNKETLQVFVKEKLKSVNSVSVGGSMTLYETGIIDILENTKDITYYDRYQKGLTKEQVQEVFRNAFHCDLYLTSTNALSEDGYLYNVDGNGNRVAAMIYGPKEVFVIIGTNKICIDEIDAIKRIEHIAAPANNVRLQKANPCVKNGTCMHCSSPSRICSSYIKQGFQGNKDRITICIVEGEYGY